MLLIRQLPTSSPSSLASFINPAWANGDNTQKMKKTLILCFIHGFKVRHLRTAWTMI